MSTVPTSLPRPGQRPAPAPPRGRSYPKPVWTAMLLWRHLRACREYRRTGVTSPEARTNLRRLFRITNGRFNDAAARLDGLLHLPWPLPKDPGVLGLAADRVSEIVAGLRRDGIHLLRERLPEDLRSRLLRLGRSAPCRVHTGPRTLDGLHAFDPSDVRGTVYQVDDQRLHEDADIQAMAGDMALLSLAQAYLGCRPIFTSATMWWSTAFGEGPDGDQAQLFHFDMNHVKFVKLFVYLTDVDEANGAHVYVRGTHRRLPRQLLEDRRFTDEEVYELYGSDRFVTVTGPAGTVFIEDTRGIHKGSHLQHGHRLCLQFQYATSPLGGSLHQVTLNDRFSGRFLDTVRRHPRIFGAKFRQPAPP